MSTYLLAWAFGDFEYIEDFTKRKYNGKNLPVRVYTTRGLKDQGKLALESAHQVVDYFSEVSKLTTLETRSSQDRPPPSTKRPEYRMRHPEVPLAIAPRCFYAPARFIPT